MAVEQKKEEEKEKLKKVTQQKPHHGQRIEIWVSADGTSSEGKAEDNLEDDLDKLEAVEVILSSLLEEFCALHFSFAYEKIS